MSPGCCAPVEDPLIESDAQEEATNHCADTCCTAESDAASGCSAAANACQDECCGAEEACEYEPDGSGYGCRDACCVSEAKECGNACCGEEEQENEDCCRSSSLGANLEASSSGYDSCTVGQRHACIDHCIDRAAAIECRAECSARPKMEMSPRTESAGLAGRPHNANASVTVKGKQLPESDTFSSFSACDQHKRDAPEKFSAVAGGWGCICRVLVASGLESCCRRPRTETKQSAHARAADFQARAREHGRAKNRRDPRGANTRSRSLQSHAPDLKTRDVERESNDPKCCGSGDCNKYKFEPVQATSCCSTKDSPQRVKVHQSVPTTLSFEKQGTATWDPEKGAAEIEHIILSVSGMTCVGCELNLARTLANFDQVQNLQVSAMLARAAFDLDTSRLSLNELLAYLGRATEFSYERVAIKGQDIDVLCPHGSKAFVKQTRPLGVTDMKSVADKVVQIVYDPDVIGARDLLKSFEPPLELAPVRSHESVEAGMKEVRKTGLITLFSALLTIPVLVLAWAPLPEHPVVYGSVSLALATIIQVFIAGPFYSVAFKNIIFSRLIEVDMLIVLSTSAAYIFSVVAFAYKMRGQPLRTGEFFETSTLIVTLIMLGRFISAWAQQRAAESISFRTLQSPTATIINEATDQESEIDARLLQYGDVFRVSPDSRIVTDGTVISGISEADESMVTGESRPVPKQIRSAVIAGSINGPGLLEVRLTRLPGDNTISAIADMVDEAKMTKAKTQEIADRIAGYFVPVVCCITVLVFIGWIGFGVDRLDYSGSAAAENAITYAIAVLIVSCPCAIGLCVPMVIVIAGGVAAKHGVIFKTGQTIELAKKTKHVVFDKTGTLTEGKLNVVDDAFPTGQASLTQSAVLGLVSNVKHPVSAAVAKYLASKGVKANEANGVTTFVGKGVEGIVNASEIRAGNSRWLNTENEPAVQAFLARGLSVFCVVQNGQLHAVFGLEDSIRPDGWEVVSALRNRGVSISIVSGDDDGAVQALAAKLAVPPSNVRSRCSPRDKVAYLKGIMQSPNDVVMFCGDGTNDAPALAQATIGVHVNKGSDVAQSAADVVLVRPSLTSVLCLIDLSHAAVRRITFNFAWAFAYNLLAMSLAAGLFVKVRISPEYAALGQIVSIIPVIIIALLLRYTKLKSCVNRQ